MFSLSHGFFPKNWIMASFSLAAWLGLSLVAHDSATATAIATPILPASPDAASFPPETDPPADQSQPFEFSAATDSSLTNESDRPASIALADPLANPSVAAPLPTSTSEAANELASELISDSGGQAATPETERMTQETIAQGTGTADSAPVPIPTFSDDPNVCFADCNPSARFDFQPPDRFSLTPTAPSSSVVQVPYPATPTDPDSTVPTPPSAIEPTPVAPGSPTAQPPQPTPVTASELDSPLPSTALTPPTLQLQGVYLYQGDEGSARARITGVYPITPRLQVGGSVDITDGDVFSEGGDDGVNINELYLTMAPQDLPNLRLVVGQLDLTSYFDRNSFAKDAATQFFNPVFSTNPALSAAGIGSRQGALVNWTITDNLEARGVVFSSDRSISNFDLNGFAGEIGLRFENLIVRGTFVTSEDSGNGDGFQEIFNIDRGNGQFGAQEGDRENAYGINAEYFIPEINLGLFGRYGHYENTDLDEDGDTFNFGINVYDLFMDGDRIGLGYGRALSNERLRQDNGDRVPDVLEVFYDFRLLPGLRAGFTYQALEEFSESIAGFRVRTEFDLIPRQP
jgi:hypothetical protein